MSRIIRIVTGGTAAGLLTVALTAAPASAHTELQSSTPAGGSQVRPPNEIRLTFGDPVRFTEVRVSDAAGHQFGAGKSHAVDNVVTEAIGATMPNGLYTVSWRVVAPDGHPVEGQYVFTVTGSAAPALAAGASATTAKSTSSSKTIWWIGLAALLVVGGGVGAFALRRGLKADEEEEESGHPKVDA